VKTIRVTPDPLNPTAPCVLVGGAFHDYAPGEAVAVLMPGARRITGCVVDWISVLGQWRIQVGPLPEGNDAVCICIPGTFNENCYYHLSAPHCGDCGPGTDVVEFTLEDGAKRWRCSACEHIWRNA